jgi:hypothetical protein
MARGWRLNDIASFDFPGINPAAYSQQLTDEFGQLYAEAPNGAD